jgi:dihydrofolate reductase
MSKVITGMRMSVDGFINDLNGNVAPLYPDMNELSATETVRESIRNTGAVVMGRNSFDMADEDYDWSTYEYQLPIFVLTHHPQPVNQNPVQAKVSPSSQMGSSLLLIRRNKRQAERTWR